MTKVNLEKLMIDTAMTRNLHDSKNPLKVHGDSKIYPTLVDSVDAKNLVKFLKDVFNNNEPVSVQISDASVDMNNQPSFATINQDAGSVHVVRTMSYFIELNYEDAISARLLDFLIAQTVPFDIMKEIIYKAIKLANIGLNLSNVTLLPLEDGGLVIEDPRVTQAEIRRGNITPTLGITVTKEVMSAEEYEKQNEVPDLD